MDLIAQIPVIGGFLSTVLPFVLVLGVVVFVHEYGHYIVARWCGIASDVFSIGFGPVLFSGTDSRGTLWQVAAIPLGGYVKFRGDADGASRADPEALDKLSVTEREHSFHGAAVWKRMLTVLAGPVFNFILSIIVFAGVVTWQGVPTERPVMGEIAAYPGTTQPLQSGDVLLEVNGGTVAGFEDMLVAALDMETPGTMQVRVERDGDVMNIEAPFAFPPLVQAVEPLSPASEAGLRSGDAILSAGGEKLVAFEDLRRVIMSSDGETIPLVVMRDGQEVSLDITPKERDTGDGEGGFEKRVMIGVAGAPLYLPATERPAPWTALWLGAVRTVMIIDQSLNGIWHIITGDLGAENLQGPLGIAQISGETAAQGLLNFVILIGVISTAIGMLNLFPIPVLDGGHFVAFLIEAVRGRPPSQAVMQVAMSIGLGLILLLMVFATYNDIMRLIS